MTRVLILGGGFGGLTVAADLAHRRLPGLEITLVDQRPNYVMGLAKLWALDGRRPFDVGRREYRRLEPAGVRFVRGVVRRIDVGNKRVQVDAAELSYDQLVVALGAELTPEKLPGLAPEMDLYTEAGVEHLRRRLESFEAGRILFVIAGVPFKCPPAPYEAALLVEALLRRRGMREHAEIRLTTPEPHPLPVAPPESGARLAQLLAEKGIEYSPNHHPTAIDSVNRLVHYQNGAKYNFDLLVGVPLHRGPAVVRTSGLADETGWVPVDARTLVTRHADVWAIGDVASVRLPNGKLLPKAGSLAAGEGRVVADQIAARIEGRTSDAAFDGQGVCYIETGDGLALPARGRFFSEPHPIFDWEVPSAGGLREKERFEMDHMKQWFG